LEALDFPELHSSVFHTCILHQVIAHCNTYLVIK
jgi:hypothetical protein